MTQKPPQEWDRHAIAAEVKRRGMTLTGIAIEAGLYENACRGCLSERWSLNGAMAIARALDIPVEVLFPHRFKPRRAPVNRSAASPNVASQKDGRRADKTQVA